MNEEIIFLVVFFLLVFVLPTIVVWATYSERGRLADFDVRELWMYHGRLDKLAVIIIGTWWVHTCSMIMWTLLRTVTTADYATYMGWAIPIIAKMFAPQYEGKGDTKEK